MSTSSPSPGLRFADCSAPGITRTALDASDAAHRWAYHAPSGRRIRRKAEIARLDAIALPPAYTNCWFSPDPDVHLLATGYDARGRKQYRYHPDWRASREASKFDLCRPFGAALSALRERVEADLEQRALCRSRAIASVVALLDSGAIRVGSERYARANKSFGATTLRTRHAKITRGEVRLHFRGKSGREREIACDDPLLVRAMRRMQDLPGQRLFQFRDRDGDVHAVHSHDVNAYLAETMGESFTAKHFRTFAASTIAFARFFEDRDVSLKAMLADVSERLGNTPAVARRSYVHPAVIAAVKGDVDAALAQHLPRRTKWLEREERGLMDFLEAQDACGT